MERLIHCHRNILWCHHFWRSYLHPSVVLELKKSDMIKNPLKSQKGLVAIPIKRWISVRIQSAEFSIRLGRRQLLNWYSLVTNDIRGLNNPTGIPTNNFSCWSILQVKETFFPWGRGNWILLRAKELSENSTWFIQLLCASFCVSECVTPYCGYEIRIFLNRSKWPINGRIQLSVMCDHHINSLSTASHVKKIKTFTFQINYRRSK